MPGQRRDHDHPRLRLPPRVDDRAPAAADVLVVPDPRLRVDRLADRSEQPQRRQVVLRSVLGPPLHVGADRGRRGVEDRHAVALGDVPPAILVGIVRRALVQHRGGAVAQRPVDDVAVAGHPADVGRAPVHVLVALEVEDVVVRRRDAHEVPRCRMRDPFRLRGRARGVEQVEQILGVHRLGRARRLVDSELVPPVVAAGGHRHVVAGPLQDDDVLHGRRRRDRFVGRALERHRRAAAPRLVLRDQNLALHVLQATAK